MTIQQLVAQTTKMLSDKSPLIMTSLGVAGVIGTAVLVGRASYRLSDILAEERQRLFQEGESTAIPFKRAVQLGWKLYIPALSTAAITIGCIIGANQVGTRRTAAMAAAYSVLEKSSEEYRNKVVEKIGEKKERDFRDELAQDRVNDNPIGSREVIITGGGDVTFYDMHTGRYFQSDMETVKKAQNDLNHRIINHQYASLNDWYDRVGLNRVPQGDDVGWNADKLMEIYFSTTMTEEQKPCITIEFQVVPTRNYFRTY